MSDLKQRHSIALVERAIRAVRAGKIVILTDDEDRENEGDLVMAAEKVTPAAINFMATHGRGLICLSLTEERLNRLNLPLMVHDNTSPFQTAFTVSIEAARGVTTGISAADRARTVKVAVAPHARPGDLVRPGHIFPLRARNGGVLVRTGQTEGSVDLARLAGLTPAGVICEVMKPDGSMARRPDLVRFARKHKLVLLSVADLITYRLNRERLVCRIGKETVRHPKLGEVTVYAYSTMVDQSVHLALVKGDVTRGRPVLTRVHRSAPLPDLLEAAGGEGTLHQAMAAIAREGRGVLVVLQKPVTEETALKLALPSNAEHVPGHGDQQRLREFGVGAQIIRDLGVSRLVLLTGARKQIVGLDSHGLTVVEQRPFETRAVRTAARTPRPFRRRP
ncbi:MAG: 3,4-dihydroxy-2-butanone-4-phosphate synthase [Myxococcaceae bacterium]|nr:3,4-dihydroxy-2-butanone-4-phosphate synthase [Myxococcaceae bacterium]